MSSTSAHNPDEAIQKIEEVLETIIDNFGREEPFSVSLRYKQKSSDLHGTTVSNFAVRSHAFPGRTPKEAWQCAVLVRILSFILEAVTSNTVVSKRNIFYKDPSLFKSQAVVDKYVDIFAYTLGLHRTDLNVTAAAKGLIVGSVTVTNPDGTTSTKGLDDQIHLIDEPRQISTLSIASISWILVVEKESTFRILASSLLHKTCPAGKGIVVTAKGYPDLSTRSFLRHLHLAHSNSHSHHPNPNPNPDPNSNPIPIHSNNNTTPTTTPLPAPAPTPTPAPPIFALTDFDPDGIAIMSTYKHGSIKLSHENARLCCGNLRWLGLRSQDIFVRKKLLFSAAAGGEGGDEDEDAGKGNDMSDMVEPRGLLRLSGRDRRKGVKMLGNSAVFGEEGGREEEWRREVQVMLMLNVKVEMEVLDEREGGVEGWVGRWLGVEIGLLKRGLGG